jgi:hypothetical protein
MQPPSSPPPSTTSAKTQDQQRKRTKDIQIDHDVDFSELLLSPPILKGLSEAGYPQWIEIKEKGKVMEEEKEEKQGDGEQRSGERYIEGEDKREKEKVS